MNAMRKKPAAGSDSPMAGGTLLTGPTGVQSGSLNIGGGKSLLGG
jgi:hypothetical protein